LIATELASVSLDFFSSFNQMQSTVPMRSNMLTLTVRDAGLGVGEGGRSVALENC
jgi:hypothetical protein